MSLTWLIYSLNENFKNYFKNYDFHNLYKELLNFCTVDLSAFYFDIRKDTLYCDSKNSKKRQSTILLLNVILNSLLKWFAPILSFTTEEIYKLLLDDNKSIHLETFLEFPEKFKNNQLNQKWLDLIKIRNICNVSIEEKREDLKWPASMYLEGSDQHRGWFHSSLLESCGTRGRAPFESILSHGFVVDGKGLKMSKSLGNVIAPEDILKKYGADILRIWVASSNYAEDLRIDHSILDQHADSYRKIRNTFRYLLGNLNDNFEKIDLDKIDTTHLPELEQFMLHKIYSLNSNFKNYFNNYDFHNLYKELLNFCTVDLSAFYFDIRKDTLYCDPLDSKKRQSTILLLNVILNSLLKWFAPILSFTTEEIYKLLLDDNKSIHLEQFLKFPENFKNDKLNQKWLDLIKIRNICNISIEEKRASKEIGSSLEAKLVINLDKKLSEITKNIDFSELCITSSAEVIYNENSETSALTSKAKGSKCPVCWKITEEACPKHSE